MATTRAAAMSTDSPVSEAEAVLEALEERVEEAVETAGRVKDAVLDRAEDGVERILFASRWLLAPLYLGLVGGLLIILMQFAMAFGRLAEHSTSSDYNLVTLNVLELLDITLLANLVLIVVFAGYETFVSKIGAAAESEDRPHWMGRIDYSGLKMKLIGSIVAISVIGLLRDFLNSDPNTGSATGFGLEKWRIGIHLTFLTSGVLFAIMDYIAERRVGLHDDRDRAP